MLTDKTSENPGNRQHVFAMQIAFQPILVRKQFGETPILVRKQSRQIPNSVIFSESGEVAGIKEVMRNEAIDRSKWIHR